MRRGHWKGLAVGAALLMVSTAQAFAQCTANCITNVIWEARLRARVGVQRYDQRLQPFMDTTGFTETRFVRSALARDLAANEVLALEFTLLPTQTNVSLIVFNKAALTVVQRITGGEETVLFLDKEAGQFKRWAYTANMPIPQTLQNLNTWRGGTLRFAGDVTQIRNVPAKVRADARGFVVATPTITPPFGPGLTGVVLRASIRTTGRPLQVLPPVVPPPAFP